MERARAALGEARAAGFDNISLDLMMWLPGQTVEQWLDVELPRVQNPRVDLLGETADRELLHIELQSANDIEMPLRMSEYCLAIRRKLGRFPRQVLVYVGEPAMTMARELRGPRQLVEWDAVDIRDLDGELLLESSEVSDNVIAILARLRNERDAVRRIVASCAGLSSGDRGAALEQLLAEQGYKFDHGASAAAAAEVYRAS